MARPKITQEENRILVEAMIRFKEYAAENDLSYSVISKEVGLSPRTFYDNFELKAAASANTFMRLAKYYNLSLNWMLLGIGPRELSESLSAESSNIHQVADTFNLHFGSGTQINREYNHPDIIRIHSNVTDSPGASVSQTVNGTPVPGQSGNTSSAPSASGQSASGQPSSGQSASAPSASGQASASDLQHQSASGSSLPSDAEVIANLQATVRNLTDTVAQQQVTVRNLSDTVTQQAVANATLSRLIDKLNM